MGYQKEVIEDCVSFVFCRFLETKQHTFEWFLNEFIKNNGKYFYAETSNIKQVNGETYDLYETMAKKVTEEIEMSIQDELDVLFECLGLNEGTKKWAKTLFLKSASLNRELKNKKPL